MWLDHGSLKMGRNAPVAHVSTKDIDHWKTKLQSASPAARADIKEVLRLMGKSQELQAEARKQSMARDKERKLAQERAEKEQDQQLSAEGTGEGDPEPMGNDTAHHDAEHPKVSATAEKCECDVHESCQCIDICSYMLGMCCGSRWIRKAKRVTLDHPHHLFKCPAPLRMSALVPNAGGSRNPLPDTNVLGMQTWKHCS